MLRHFFPFASYLNQLFMETIINDRSYSSSITSDRPLDNQGLNNASYLEALTFQRTRKVNVRYLCHCLFSNVCVGCVCVCWGVGVWVCVCVCVCVCAFVNAGKRGHTLVNEQVNVDTSPNVDVLGLLLCPRD